MPKDLWQKARNKDAVKRRGTFIPAKHPKKRKTKKVTGKTIRKRRIYAERLAARVQPLNDKVLHGFPKHNWFDLPNGDWESSRYVFHADRWKKITR